MRKPLGVRGLLGLVLLRIVERLVEVLLCLYKLMQRYLGFFLIVRRGLLVVEGHVRRRSPRKWVGLGGSERVLSNSCHFDLLLNVFLVFNHYLSFQLPLLEVRVRNFDVRSQLLFDKLQKILLFHVREYSFYRQVFIEQFDQGLILQELNVI